MTLLLLAQVPFLITSRISSPFQLASLVAEFSDQKMLKLKEVIADLKRQERANGGIRQALDKAKKKVEKLEAFLATTSAGSKMQGYLDEFE